MSESIEVPKEVIEKFNEVNLRRKENGENPLMKYIAMDGDGCWYGYCTKPEKANDNWDPCGGDWVILKSNCAPYWQNSLTEMPLEDV